jgi:hypothetical protein
MGPKIDDELQRQIWACQIFCVRRFCVRLCLFFGASALTPKNDRRTGWQIAPSLLSIQSRAASEGQILIAR